MKIDKKPFVRIKTVCLILMAGLIPLSMVKAQDKSARQPMPLFQSDEILNLELEADFKTVFSVTDDSTYFPAKLSLTENNGQKQTMDIRIRTRGITRREKDVCRFPPLRLNFPKKETGNTPFEGQNALKLVTHCDKADYYEQNIIIEYLIYRVYNVLTDSSFKVRPAMIDYIFPDKKADTVRRFAFFIEREKHLTGRLDRMEIDSVKFHPNRLNPFQTCLMDMFQYMIGNTDYSITELHNIILVADSARKFPPVAIPYDFDWSGLVSAVYAVPHPLINTEKVTERVYRGFKKDPFIVNHTIQVFNAKKQEIYKLFENYELLDDDEEKKAIKYLDDFYWIINNERMVQIEFFDRARIIHD
jgi:hypothetical protein